MRSRLQFLKEMLNGSRKKILLARQSAVNDINLSKLRGIRLKVFVAEVEEESYCLHWHLMEKTIDRDYKNFEDVLYSTFRFSYASVLKFSKIMTEIAKALYAKDFEYDALLGHPRYWEKKAVFEKTFENILANWQSFNACVLDSEDV